MDFLYRKLIQIYDVKSEKSENLKLYIKKYSHKFDTLKNNTLIQFYIY